MGSSKEEKISSVPVVKEPVLVQPTCSSEIGKEKLSKITAEEQKRQVERHRKITIMNTTSGIVNNADVGLGGIGMVLFGLSFNSFAKGLWLDGGIFFLASIFISIAKHRVPEGTLVQYLKQPTQLIVADVREKIEEVKKTFRGE